MSETSATRIVALAQLATAKGPWRRAAEVTSARTPAKLSGLRDARRATRDSADRTLGHKTGLDGGRYAFLRRVLETDLGKQLYGKRQVTIEPVFANTKFNRRIDRFLRAGDPPAGRNGG